LPIPKNATCACVFVLPVNTAAQELIPMNISLFALFDIPCMDSSYGNGSPVVHPGCAGGAGPGHQTTTLMLLSSSAANHAAPVSPTNNGSDIALVLVILMELGLALLDLRERFGGLKASARLSSASTISAALRPSTATSSNTGLAMRKPGISCPKSAPATTGGIATRSRMISRRPSIFWTARCERDPRRLPEGRCHQENPDRQVCC